MTIHEKWVTVRDVDIRHIWEDPDDGTEVAIPPTFYQDAGTPISAESGDDMTYLRTEVRWHDSWTG